MWASIITNATTIILFLGAILGIYYHFEKRVDRVYGRIDEIKKDFDERFVRKDICAISHTSTTSLLTGLETRIEKRLDKLELLLSDTMTKIMARLDEVQKL
jgi:uncharacterized membrane protein YqgA involved in biofilm formation